MQAGLQVFNDSNIVQIDATWKNYSLLSAVTLISSNNYWGELDYAGVIYTTDNPTDLIFAYCASPFYPICLVQQSGLRSYRIGTGASTGVPVTFYTFRQQQPTNSLFGLQVYDQTGNLTFDSSNKVNRVAGQISLTVSSQPNFYNYSGNGKYAIMVSSFTGQLVQQDSGAGQGGMGFRYLSTNAPRFSLSSTGVSFQGFGVCSVKQIPIQNPTPGVIVTNYNGSPYVITDIGGYD